MGKVQVRVQLTHGHEGLEHKTCWAILSASGQDRLRLTLLYHQRQRFQTNCIIIVWYCFPNNWNGEQFYLRKWSDVFHVVLWRILILAHVCSGQIIIFSASHL